MRGNSRGRIDILCLCNDHMVGGAMSNAGLLTSEFSRRGYRSELGFLFECEPDARHGTESFFVIEPGKPKSPTDWKRFLAGCNRELVGRRPRVIIGFQPISNIIGAFAARRIGDCRMIATQRIPAETLSARSGALERLVGSTNLFDSNIAVSQTVADSFGHYPQRYRKKIKVVLNATPPIIENFDARAKCRERFGMPSDRIVLGCLGRLHVQKNVSFALDVLAGIPNAVLFLAGEGPEEDALRSKAEALGVGRRVVFVGSLNGEDISRFYRSLDVLLFPSVYEGFGRVLAEAMSQQVPVVASDIPIVREVGGSAIVTRPWEVSAWVDAISRICTDSAFTERVLQLGLERSAAFKLPAMVDGYLAAAGLPRTSE